MISQRRTSPYSALSASSTLWMLPAELPINEILNLHAHHADELVIPWTRRGVARAARLLREADDFQAPMLALARWLEHAPAEHGPLLVDAVLGPQDVDAWSRSAIQPCGPCGFPPDVHSGREATSRHLLANLALHPGASARARTPYAYPEEDPDDPDR
jgi:hypothetical protein